MGKFLPSVYRSERTEGIGNFPVNNTGKFPIWRIWNKERIVKFPIVIQWETLQNERRS